MRLPLLLRTLAAVFALVTLASVAAPPPDPAAFARLSGEELVARLADKAGRARAFHELWRRGDPKHVAEFESFAESHTAPEVVVCPQEKGQAPLYIVLSGFRRTYPPPGDERYAVANPA